MIGAAVLLFVLALIALGGACVGLEIPCGDGYCSLGYECVQNMCRYSNPTCGKGLSETWADEVCDDGNDVGGDGCSADCKSNETCGNGVVDIAAGEACDCGAGDVQSPQPECKGQQNSTNGVPVASHDTAGLSTRFSF
ncbi:DUF4215 domain-containing protein [Polyangium sp. 15x6]|uniref:DUF4215 domain-containing protein n=1 Tax=Polyangium sp. 15x6 TaxID=3042687 RepID=UPI00249B84C1|nr:DUF4215 domain-containing protein [Polyangium sp. 15x6]MDI3285317.1 hypothetical protein [Polyangium sp. 15x6]